MNLGLYSAGDLALLESSTELEEGSSAEDENRRGDGMERVRIRLSPNDDGIMKEEPPLDSLTLSPLSSSSSSSSSSPSLSSVSVLRLPRIGMGGILKSLRLEEDSVGDGDDNGNDVLDVSPPSTSCSDDRMVDMMKRLRIPHGLWERELWEVEKLFSGKWGTLERHED